MSIIHGNFLILQIVSIFNGLIYIFDVCQYFELILFFENIFIILIDIFFVNLLKFALGLVR